MSFVAVLLIASISFADGTASFGYWVSDGGPGQDTEWTNPDNWELDPPTANYPANDAHAVIQDTTASVFPVIADGQDYQVELLSLNYWGPTDGETAEFTIESGGAMNASEYITLNQGGINDGFHDVGDVVINVELGGTLGTTNMLFGEAGSSATINVDGTVFFPIMDMKDGDNEIVLGDTGQLYAFTDWWGPELDGIDNNLEINNRIVAENEAPGFGVIKLQEEPGGWTILGVGQKDYFELQILADGDMASGLNAAAGETGPPAWYLYDYQLFPEEDPSPQTVAYTEEDASVGVRSIEFDLSDYADPNDFKASATNSNYIAQADELYRLEFDYKTIDFEQRDNPETGDPEGSDAFAMIRFFDEAVAEIGAPIVYTMQDTEGQWATAEPAYIEPPEETEWVDVAFYGSLNGNSKGTIRIDNVKLYQTVIDEYEGADVTTWEADPNGPAPTDWNLAGNWNAGIPGTSSLVLFGWVFETGPEGEEYFTNPLAVIDEPVLPFNALGMGWWDDMGHDPEEVALDWEIQITDGGEMTVLEWIWMGAGAETTNTLTVDGGSLTVPALNVPHNPDADATVYHSGGEVNVTAWLQILDGSGVYYISDDAVLTLAGNQTSYVLDELVPEERLVPVVEGEEELIVEFDGENTIISIGVPLCGVWLDTDLNRDCFVDAADLALLLSEWLDPAATQWFADMSVDPVEQDDFYRRDGLEPFDEYVIEDGLLVFEAGFVGDLSAAIDTFPAQVFNGEVEMSARWRVTEGDEPLFEQGEIGPPAISMSTNTDEDPHGFIEFVIWMDWGETEQNLSVVTHRNNELLRLDGFDTEEMVEFTATVDASDSSDIVVTIDEATDGTTTYTDESASFAAEFEGAPGVTWITLLSHGITGEVDWIEFSAERELEYDLTGNNEVNFEDFAVLAIDWMEDTVGQFE